MTHLAGSLWYALSAYPEERALSSLLRASIEGWLPLRRVMHRTRSGKPVAGSTALFPGYLFARFDARGETWRWIGELDGVRRILCATEEHDSAGRLIAKPVPIRAQWIEGLREKIAADGGSLRTEDEAARSFFKKGQALRIIGGPWQGFPGVFDAEDDAANIWAWLNVFGRATRARLPVASVEAMEA